MLRVKSFNISITKTVNGMDSHPSVPDTRPQGVSDMLEIRAVIQRELDRLGKCADGNLIQLKKSCPNIAQPQANHLLGCISKCVDSRLRK